MNKLHILSNIDKIYDTTRSLNRQNRSKQLDFPTIYPSGLNGWI
jgi:predicted membrane GTPase involved in stress response